ncbi:MAG: hypothetical protein NC340_00620 [Ruminococcus flavefaciens]|nr:hypothetical protein [Ruminococcus flavefaciens]MCM1228615.1 hypothetical protein [Ruminococcus flavefaciens]
MKKSLTILPLCILAATLCTACGDKGNNSSDSGSYYEDHDYGYGNSDRDTNDSRDNRDDRDGNDISDDFSDVGEGIRDTVDDVVDEVEDAGEGIVSGAESAMDDMTGSDRTTQTAE